MTQWPRGIITLYLYSPLCYKGLCDWTAPAGILILGLNFVKLNRFVWPIHCVERWSEEESNHIHYSHYTEPIRRITNSSLKLIEIGLNPQSFYTKLCQEAQKLQASFITQHRLHLVVNLLLSPLHFVVTQFYSNNLGEKQSGEVKIFIHNSSKQFVFQTFC